MVPTGTGKPGKIERYFPVREKSEFCQNWKIQGALKYFLALLRLAYLPLAIQF